MAKISKHTPEFRANAVALMQQRTKTVEALAEDLGVSAPTLYVWKNKLEQKKLGNVDRVAHFEKLYLEAEKKRKEAEIERDILKKALAFFAKS
jgi:transposase